MKKHSLRFLTFIFMGILIYSCQDEIENTPQTEPLSSEQFAFEPDEQITLGKKLENPYSVENMRLALENLKKSNLKAKTSEGGIEISTTHLYVKFKPKTEEELTILQNDTTLVLYNYPLDYEIEGDGGFYHDPEIPKDQPTYQYCSVLANKILPNEVEYEILAELFIPEEDDDVEEKTSFSKKEEIVDALVDEALRITNNLEDIQNNDITIAARRRKWTPAGQIKVWDDVVNKYVPITGVKVKARRWFRTRTGITNSEGKYSCDGRFRRKARYLIKWKRHDFSIRWSWMSSAKYRGPRIRGNWNLNIKGGTQQYYATIFRAAHHYYYENIKGLKRPPTNSFWKPQMKISARYETNTESNGSHNKSIRIFGVFSRIKIFNPQNRSSDIYATTIHELAHASHWELRKNNWNDNNLPSKVKESWARGVQWELTRMVYSSYQPFYFGNYTGVVQDLIDGKSNYDQVENYTIKEIENVLSSTSSWDGWKNNLKNKYNNATENNLDAVFNRW